MNLGDRTTAQSGRWYREGNRIFIDLGNGRPRLQGELDSEVGPSDPFSDALGKVMDPRIDVTAQRTLIAMLKSQNASDRTVAATIVNFVVKDFDHSLGGIYQSDQEVAVEYAATNGKPWWEMLGKKKFKLVCNLDTGDPVPILVFRKDLKQPDLRLIFHELAIFDRFTQVKGFPRTGCLSGKRVCDDPKCKRFS